MEILIVIVAIALYAASGSSKPPSARMNRRARKRYSQYELMQLDKEYYEDRSQG